MSKDSMKHHNKSLEINRTKPTNSEATAAWCNANKKEPETNVSIPNEQSVINAKEWVDNGSRL